MLFICSWTWTILVVTLLSQSVMILSPQIVVNCQKPLNEGQRPCECHLPCYNFDWLDLVQDLAASLSCCNFTSAIAMSFPVHSISLHSSSSILSASYSLSASSSVFPEPAVGWGILIKLGQESLYWLPPTTKKVSLTKVEIAPWVSILYGTPCAYGQLLPVHQLGPLLLLWVVEVPVCLPGWDHSDTFLPFLSFLF